MKEDLIPKGTKAVILTACRTQLEWAECDMRNSGKLGNADWPATWSKPVEKRWHYNYHETSKSRTAHNTPASQHAM